MSKKKAEDPVETSQQPSAVLGGVGRGPIADATSTPEPTAEPTHPFTQKDVDALASAIAVLGASGRGGLKVKVAGVKDKLIAFLNSSK